MASPIPGNLGPVGDFNTTPARRAPLPRTEKAVDPQDGYASLPRYNPENVFKSVPPRPLEAKQAPATQPEPLPLPDQPLEKKIPNALDELLARWDIKTPIVLDPHEAGHQVPAEPAPPKNPKSQTSQDLLWDFEWSKIEKKPGDKVEHKKPQLDDIWGGKPPTHTRESGSLHTKMLLGDLWGEPAKVGRFQGSWSDYNTRVAEHNKEVDRRNQEEIARNATRGDMFGSIGLLSMGGQGGPRIPAPPLLPQAEALELWNNRHAASLGRVMTPPVGEIPPEVKRVQSKIEDMIEKMAGDALRAKGIKLHVNLFSGDALNAFAGRNSDDWEGSGKVTPERAKRNASIATLRPQLDPESKGGPIYELGITAGALRKLETEDELAFLLGHELAHLLEGHVEPVGRSWLSSQSHEAVADHEGFRMMLKAGYDPAQGLRLLNRLHEGHEAQDIGTLMGGLSHGASSHHHEGVRVALGQIKLEQMRRSDTEAQPTEVVRPLPDWMKLEAEASLDFDPDKKLASATRQLGLDFMNSEPKASYSDRYLKPPDSQGHKDLYYAPWEPKTAGALYQQALEAIEGAPGTAQKKGDSALLLLHALSEKGYDKDGAPDLSKVSQQVTTFFQRQTEQGWKADKFLENMAQGAPDGRVDSQFALKVLFSPGFQEIDLYHSNAEWKTLVDAAPQMLATSNNKYCTLTSGALKGVATGLTILAGANPKGRNYDGDNWPKDVPAGQGKLDDVHRRNLTQYISIHADSGKWNEYQVQNTIYAALEKAEPGPFSQQIHQAMKPVDVAIEKQQGALLQGAFLTQDSAQKLFRSAVFSPLSQEQTDQLKQKFVDLPSPEHFSFKQHPVFGQMLGELLDSEQTSVAHKAKVAQYMMTNIDTGGLGQPTGVPGLASLYRYLGEQNPGQLLKTIRGEVSKRGLGITPPPPPPPGSVGMMSANLGGSFGGPKHCPTPQLSTLGFQRTLSPKVAAQLDGATLDRWLDTLKVTKNEIDAGTRLFLLDAFIAQQGQHKDLDSWFSQFNGVMQGSYRFLEGRAEVRERLADHLYPALSEQKPDKVRTWLTEDKVQSILKTDQTAELMARLITPGEPGVKYDAASLRKELVALEKEFKIEDKPALRRALHEKIAERAHLQPHQMDVVFPNDERSISQQAKGVDKEIRGLSAMVAATRTRAPQEQLQMIEFLMGRVPDAPAFLEEMDKLASKNTGISSIKLSDLIEETRRTLADADPGVRTAVATSFLAGPTGLLRDPDGRKMLLNHFTEPVRPANKELATSLATVLLDAHGSQDALAVGYLLSQKGKGGQALSEGEVLNSLFDAYGVPGIKLKQYLAFTSDFAEFREHFESSQDSAMPLNYYQAVKLVQHHYGDKWPKDWEVQDVIGSGSVNVAVRFKDHTSKETRVVSLPREQVETCSEYDFWRMGQFLDLFTKEPENQEKYGFLRGLTEVIRDSVSLEFNRDAAFKMQQSVENFYERKVGDWTIKTVKAHSLDGQAIVMEEAKGRTARRVLGDKPEVYKSAMQAMAQVETDALLGIETEKNPTPKDLHANPDFHDGQVLIDEATHTVTILDFGQAVPIGASDREYAIDLLTIIGQGYKPEEAARLLQKRTGAQVDGQELAKILSSTDQMDVFTKMLGTMTQHGAKIPLPVVHWVLGMNRQRALGEKLDAPIDKKLRTLAAVRMTGGSLEAYNALRIARRSPMQALRGGILGPLGGWVEKLLSEQNLLDLVRGKVKPLTLQ